MTAPTRVRRQRYLRHPVPLSQWTPGDHQPTALALAAPGLLGQIAEKMGKHVATLEKWAQGERGPELDLRELFPTLRDVGVSRECAGLIVARIKSYFEAAYRDHLPTLKELYKPETATDNAEEDAQMDCVLAHDDLDHQERYLLTVLADIAMLDTVAARITRNLQAAGRL